MDGSDRIKPWPDNPAYWQFKGAPVVLMGGTREDNLFQKPYLEEELDLLVSAGGNYIRNTMSDRDEGDVYPYERRPDGAYDLDQWNDEYWLRFESMLRLAAERDVIVQIEVWDRFDLTDATGADNWQRHPYRPANNVNYSAEETGLGDTYPDHPASDLHPFYHTVPGMAAYRPPYDRIRAFQERYVGKLVSVSLPYGNVLYCMNNETSTEPAWGRYWIAFIKERATAAGVDVHCTDMFDDVWRPEESAMFAQVIARPDVYDFIEVSQVNSRNFGADHWRRVMYTREEARKHPRPRNNTKIYSDGQTEWGSGLPQDGIERFWRHLLAGAASVRFHRPTAGIGSNPLARACIRTARAVEKTVPFWRLSPRQDLLRADGDNTAYLAADDGNAYVVFFSDGGSVDVDFSAAGGELSVQWTDVGTGEPTRTQTMAGGTRQTMHAPGNGPQVAVVRRYR